MADPAPTIDDLRGQRDQLGQDIRAKHIAIERAQARAPDADYSAALADVADAEKRWKDLNAKVVEMGG